MIDFLVSLDRQLFYFVNVTLANPVTDFIMPILTSDWVLRIGYLCAMVVILWKGTKQRRLLVLCSVLALAATDLVVSAGLKPLFGRLRPCHDLTDIHLLVNCGTGFSMPSSHAANAFGQAVFWGVVFKPWRWALFSLALFISLSRIFVGVHYPADITVGALIGVAIGWVAQRVAQKFLPRAGAERSL